MFKRFLDMWLLKCCSEILAGACLPAMDVMHAWKMIYNDNYALVIGGGNRNPVEKCILSNNQMDCTIPDPESKLSEYKYPGLFLETSDFCKNHVIKY